MATERAAAAGGGGSPSPPRSPRRTTPWVPKLRRQSSQRVQLVMEGVPETNVGVCLASNGGYHGVAFCAGALQSMLASRLRIDHLSAVSSGALVGAAYMDWKVREGGVDHPEWHERFFRQLRDNLATTARRAQPDMRGLLAAAVTSLVHGIASLLLLVGVCFPFLRSHLNHVRWIGGLSELAGCLPVPLWPPRALAPAAADEPLSVILYLQVFAIAMLLLRPRFGKNPGLSMARHVVFMLFSILPLMIYVWTTAALLQEGERLRVLFGDACRDMLTNGSSTTATATASSTATATAQAALDPSNPYGCNLLARMVLVAVPGVAFLIHVFVLALFLGTRRSFLVTLTSFSINLVLLAQKPYVVGDSAGYSAWSEALAYTGMVAFFAMPLLLPMHQHASVRKFEESLRNSFFHPSKKNSDFLAFRRNVLRRVFKSSHTSPSKDVWQHRQGCDLPNDLTFGDLAHTSPELIVQMSLLNWQNSANNDDTTKLLSVSSKMGDVIYRREREDINAYLDVVPTIVPLSSAVATSFVDVSMLFTSVKKSFELMREIFFLLSPQSTLKLPVWADPAPTLLSNIIKATVIGLIHVAASLDAVAFLLWRDAPWSPLSEIALLFRCALVFVTLFPSDKSVAQASPLQQVFFMLSRWVNVNIPFCQYVRSIACATTDGEFPDFILEIGSSAHLEHTGLLALLKRNTSRIIIVDAGTPHSVNRAERIMETLQRARKNFGCRFCTVDNEDLTYELFRTMGSSTRGVAPHAIQFKVYYTAEGEESRVITGEGHIVLLQPRHPDQLKDGEWSGDLHDGWCAEEADNLFGAFTSASRDWMNRSMAEAYHGKFPYYDRAFYPTPEQTEAMFREGERVMSAPGVRDFVDESPKMPGVHRCTDSLSSLPEEMEDSTPSPSSGEEEDGDDDVTGARDDDVTGARDMSQLGLGFHFQQAKDSMPRLRRSRPIAEISPVDDEGRATAAPSSKLAAAAAAASPPPPALPPRPARAGRTRESFTPLESPVDVPLRSRDKPTPPGDARDKPVSAGDAHNALTRVAMAVAERDTPPPPPLPPKPKMFF